VTSPAASPPAPAGWTARLEALRSDGGARLDPAQLRYLEALARRLAGQPEAVRRLLEGKLEAGIDAFAARLAAAPARAPKPRHPTDAGPLAGLNAYIRTATAARLPPPLPGEPRQDDELPSVQRFRSAWSRSRSQRQVEQAVARKPANAGPLNSHALVLQSLGLMRELSPGYLRRFLAHVESLQWLEQAGERHRQQKAADAAPARPRGRRKKPAP
jgi:hypothetical protein